MRLYGKRALVSGLVFGLILVACTPADTGGLPAQPFTAPVEGLAAGQVSEFATVVEVAASRPDLSTLVAAIESAELVATLNGEGPFTVFAPTNAAFEKALVGLNISDDDLFADTETLTTILTYHIVTGKLMAADVLAEEELFTMQGSGAAITPQMSNGSIEDARIIMTDIEASNGVIHIIDRVILPANWLASLP